MALVGVIVHSAEKEGLDAGELCGLGPIGVAATRDIDDILPVKPDCVLYMQQGMDIEADLHAARVRCERGDDLRRVPSPGKHGRATRARVEAACERGATSIHSTGISPGFISEAMPIVLSLHPAQAGPPSDRRVRGRVESELSGNAVPIDGFRPRSAPRSIPGVGPTVPPRSDLLCDFSARRSDCLWTRSSRRARSPWRPGTSRLRPGPLRPGPLRPSG